MYDYDEDPSRTQRAEEPQEEESDWKMVAPGEMVAPGQGTDDD